MNALANRLGGGERVPRAIAGLGVVLFVSVPAQWVAFEGFRPVEFAGTAYLVSLLTNGVPALGIAYGGYWLERSDLSPERYPRIAGWCFGGLAVFSAINLLIVVTFPADTLQMNVGWMIGSAIFGAVGGSLIGIVEAGAIERALAANRAKAEADRAETEREWFDYLNSLLRHEVLNTANVIEGQAILLADEHEGEGIDDRVESIRRQSRNMTRVIEDVRVLIRATEDINEFGPVRLDEVIETEVRSLEDAYETVDVSTDLPEDAVVRGDDLLPRVFSNLLHNAVEHNDADTPRVEITAEIADGVLAVDIADNGPGIPPAERARLFERNPTTGSDHGLGLYLVDTLVERYEGDVQLVETGSEGTTFRVELPLASAAAETSVEPGIVPDVIAADGRGDDE